jgi:hypothetical protein
MDAQKHEVCEALVDEVLDMSVCALQWCKFYNIHSTIELACPRV